jgi:hypothetical protein
MEKHVPISTKTRIFYDKNFYSNVLLVLKKVPFLQKTGEIDQPHE